MKKFCLVGVNPAFTDLDLGQTVDLNEDDLQEICAALVKANQRRLAEKIADLVASTEDQQ